jgi:hypothetical protein
LATAELGVIPPALETARRFWDAAVGAAWSPVPTRWSSEKHLLHRRENTTATAARCADVADLIDNAALDGSGAASLARPGGNVTGTTSITGELQPKLIELAHELVPEAIRVSVIGEREILARAENHYPPCQPSRRAGRDLRSSGCGRGRRGGRAVRSFNIRKRQRITAWPSITECPQSTRCAST